MTPSESAFLDEVIAVACTLPRTILDTIGNALETLSPTALPAERQALVRTIVQTKAREAFSRLFTAWDTHVPHLAPSSVAWTLRAASRADEFRRQSQTLELVWTGPAPLASPLRRTDQVLLDLIQHARRSLMIVMFAAYKIPEIVIALTQAIQRGVIVTLIVESSEESGGKTTFETIAAMEGPLTHAAAMYVWPLDQRPRDAAGRYGSLHAKCAVADDAVAFISSANLTEFALNLNMELGVLIRGGNLPSQVATHLRRLIEQGILVSTKPTH